LGSWGFINVIPSGEIHLGEKDRRWRGCLFDIALRRCGP
jgi:hypothetical protein